MRGMIGSLIIYEFIKWHGRRESWPNLNYYASTGLENHQDNLSPVRVWNPGYPEYKAVLLTANFVVNYYAVQ
jgi:hypothetical protein